MDVFKLLLRHDHHEAAICDQTIADGLNEQTYYSMKQNFLAEGKLSVRLLRRLWWSLRLEPSAFNFILKLLEQFDIGMVASTDEEGHPKMFLLPSFFPQFLPSLVWRSGCLDDEIQVSRNIYQFRDWMPAGLVQRLQVCLHRISSKAWYAQEGAIVKLGGAQCLLRKTVVEDYSGSPVLQVTARGKEQMWISVNKLYAVIDDLLTFTCLTRIFLFCSWILKHTRIHPEVPTHEQNPRPRYNEC